MLLGATDRWNPYKRGHLRRSVPVYTINVGQWHQEVTPYEHPLDPQRAHVLPEASGWSSVTAWRGTVWRCGGDMDTPKYHRTAHQRVELPITY